jgi:hypothetical protein
MKTRNTKTVQQFHYDVNTPDQGVVSGKARSLEIAKANVEKLVNFPITYQTSGDTILMFNDKWDSDPTNDGGAFGFIAPVSVPELMALSAVGATQAHNRAA